MKHLILLLFSLVFTPQGWSQETYPVNGVKTESARCYAFTNANIHVNSKTIIKNGTLIIEKGRITEVSERSKIPKHAIEIDLKGKHIYASFIDTYTAYGLPEAKKPGWSNAPQYESTKKGAVNWNESIHPEIRAIELFKADNRAAGELRAIGFGTVASHAQDGLMRGTSVLATLDDNKEVNTVIKSEVAAHYSFRKGSSAQAYPSSLMGNIALLKQTYYDARWYAQQQPKTQEDMSLDALNRTQNLIQIFEADNKYNVIRADKMGDELGVQYIFKTNGTEYQRVNEMKATNATFIVPVNFPEAFDVEDVYDAASVSLSELKHWELAPGNLNALFKNGIKFCITAADLKDKKSFISNIQKAISYGLPAEEALKALTETPAALLGVSNEVGTLDKGKLANFIITSGEIFSDANITYENWVQGNRYILQQMEALDIRGEYSLNIDNNYYTLSVTGEIPSPSAEIKLDSVKTKANIKKENNNVTISFLAKDKNYTGAVRLSGNINFDSGSWDGNGQLPDGKKIKWTAIRKSKSTETKKPKTPAKDSLVVGSLFFPNMAYGWDSIPKAESYLIKNATIWTNESNGILKNADVLIRNGIIAEVGTALAPDKKTVVIDAKGKHVTAGIIDEHSHIAISGGVNEGGQAISAEVSIGDVVNPDDINIYRQLSGGVTASQLLHGSANPIGGQSALIKLRWGSSPEEMKIKGADGFIKCALGENVKQANWGEAYNVRFPQTRMGVEQSFYDAFYRARAYEAEWKNYNEIIAKGKLKPAAPRKDIECEILLEILNGKRFITCHSYVQSEINMLMHVADSMGFKINTFTHILEGYKVADKMAKHGVSGSSFSDWWAYKFEVYDAIPYNAAIMHAQGVNVGINSDDAEMARRLNQEAAKSIKYGGMSEEEALKMVTLNPAKMLHLDKRMGSIKPGKDADIVIWSDNPMSIYAKAEKTFVDGICYFDIDRDIMLRERNEKEGVRIIQKMIEAKRDGASTQKPVRKSRKLYHCDTLEEEEEF